MNKNNPMSRAKSQPWQAGWVVVWLVTLFAGTACGGQPTPTRPTSTLAPVGTPLATAVAVCKTTSGTRVPCSKITRMPDPPYTPTPSKITAPIITVTGTVINLGTSQDGKSVRLVLKPDAPGMKFDFTISDWSRATVLFYWEGLQTPTPVANGNAVVAQNALNHRITLGYYATEPPTVSLVSIHKQKGDSQK